MMQMVQGLLGFIYPKKCILCRSILDKLDNPFVCRLCYDKIYAETDNLSKLKPGQLSDWEDDLELPEDMPKKIISLFPYEAEYRKAILRWKYRGVRKYAKGFAKLLVELKKLEEIEEAVLIPIPLAPSRMKKRGFNQALDLAVEIGRLTGSAVTDCLKRIQDTKPQSACSKEERYTNVKGSMTIVNNMCMEVKSIILVDDIYTTGSTIKEAIRVIRELEVFRNTSVYVVVIGKGDF